MTNCCSGSGMADYASVPCPNPECTASVVAEQPVAYEYAGGIAYRDYDGESGVEVSECQTCFALVREYAQDKHTVWHRRVAT